LVENLVENLVDRKVVGLVGVMAAERVAMWVVRVV
jgi:hypothetical protein